MPISSERGSGPPGSGQHDLEATSMLESKNEPLKPCEEFDTLRTIAEAELLDDRFRTTERGLQMMALGGTIGTGLFVATGQALYMSGPASLLIAYILVAIVVFCVVTAIAEIATYLPVHGGTMS